MQVRKWHMSRPSTPVQAHVCPVCLDDMSSDDPACIMVHPGCKMHCMHAVCALNNAQYDLRCPVCRQLHDGAQQRAAKPTLLIHSSAVQGQDALNGSVLEALVARLDATVVNEPDQAEELESSDRSDIVRATRSYNSRRARTIRSDARLSELREKVDRSRRRANELCRELESTWVTMQREAWRSDGTITALRRLYHNSRRQHNRWERMLEHTLLSRIGGRPALGDAIA